MKKQQKENELTQYDILSYHDSWFILTTDGKNPSVIVTPWNYDHFLCMGKDGFLTGEAKELYENN